MKFPEWHGMIVALGIGGAENEGRKKILRLCAQIQERRKRIETAFIVFTN